MVEDEVVLHLSASARSCVLLLYHPTSTSTATATATHTQTHTRRHSYILGHTHARAYIHKSYIIHPIEEKYVVFGSIHLRISLLWDMTHGWWTTTLQHTSVTPCAHPMHNKENGMITFCCKSCHVYLQPKYVYLWEDTDHLPKQSPYDFMIDLEDGASPPFGPIYGISDPKLEAFRMYIDENHARGFIWHSKYPGGAPILFVKKKDGSL